MAHYHRTFPALWLVWEAIKFYIKNIRRIMGTACEKAHREKLSFELWYITRELIAKKGREGSIVMK